MILSLIAHAGGGPANVMVLYNADSDEALATAHYYAAARDLDEEHLCGVQGVDPSALTIKVADYEPLILAPLQACIATLDQPDDIDYVVIVRDLPYRVDMPDDGFSTSLGAMIQVARATRRDNGDDLMGTAQARQGSNGLRYASVGNPLFLWGSYSRYSSDYTASYGYSPYYVTSSYIGRGEAAPPTFRRVNPDASERLGSVYDWTDQLLVVTRLDGFDHSDARDLVDRAIAAETTRPVAPFVCMHARDPARGVRDAECEHTLRLLAGAGFPTKWISEFDPELSGQTVAAYWTGSANLKGSIDGQIYEPGAIAHNLTSTGAAPRNFVCSEDGEICPERESQTSIARFIRAGATGAHGTVREPLNNTFPNAGTMLLYAHGYSMGESWFFNQRFLYWVNLYIGDPLTTPYAARPVVTVPDSTPVNLDVQIDAQHENGVAHYRVYADNRLVYDGAEPAFSVQDIAAPGDVVQLLVVATANDVAVDYTGVWPAESPVEFKPMVQGWLRTELSIEEAFVESVIDPEPEGCGGCSTSQGAAWWGLLPLLLIVRRRRSLCRR